MTGIFKANNPNNNFLLFLYGLVLKLPLFIFPGPAIVQAADGVLYKGLVYYGQTRLGSPVMLSLLGFLLLVIQAASLNKIVNDHRMFQRPNYLTGMSYLLITSVFSEWFVFSSALVANTFLIWVWSKLSTLHNQPSPRITIFNIGLAIGLASFFYQPAIVFVFLFIIGLAATRPFRLNEWMIGLLGLLTCFYFFAVWLFLSDRWNSFEWPLYEITIPAFRESWWTITGILSAAIAMLLGVYFVQSNMRRQVVQTRKSWYLIYFYLVVAAFVPFINAHSFTSWILVAVPAAILVAAALFYPDRKWFPLLIHWVLVAIYITGAFYFR